MIEWLKQPVERQRELIDQVSSKTGLPAIAIEKDWWVTLALQAVFQTEWSDALVFKGGTSLSKAWKIIERFSEDIDLVLDRSVLGFAGDLSKSKVKELRKRSCEFTSGPFREAIEAQLLAMGVPKELFTLTAREVTASDTDPQVLVLKYRSVVETTSYLKEAVLIEVGARSLREPAEPREIASLITETLGDPDLSGKPFQVLTVVPARTFLEKAFLLHEEFAKPGDSAIRDRMSRHLYDLERLMDTEHSQKALDDQELYQIIVVHREQYNTVRGLDYAGHQPHLIDFVPPEAVLKEWEADYKAMQENMIYGDALSFKRLIDRVTELRERFRKIKTD